jgi:hypothetical protein
MATDERTTPVVPHKQINGDYPVSCLCTSEAPMASQLLTPPSSSTVTRNDTRILHPSARADTSSHFKRVVGYARPSDWAYGAGFSAIGPALMLYWERVSPSYVGKGGFAPIMRLTGAVGLTGGFLLVYSNSISEYLAAQCRASTSSDHRLLQTASTARARTDGRLIWT